MLFKHPNLGLINCVHDSKYSLIKFLGLPYGSISQRFARSTLNSDLSTKDATRGSDGIFDASRPGPSSIQPSGSVRTDASNIPLPTGKLPSDEEQSEDCLNLSIHVPKCAFNVAEDQIGLKCSSKLAVLVFIHGGAYCLGSGNRPYYSPLNFIRHATSKDPPMPFIFVSINYRLGGLGFYHCPQAPDLLPPNNGLHDQLVAFEWLKENIMGFGGDTENMTVIGQSAGGESISLHAFAGREGRDLGYVRAIMMSGSLVTMPPKTPQEYGEVFLAEAEKLGIAMKDDIGGKRSTAEIAKDMIKVDVGKIRDLGFVGLPCTDSGLLPYEKPSTELMKSGTRVKQGWVEAQIIGSATYDGGISYNMMARDSRRKEHAKSFIKISKEVLSATQAQHLCEIYGLAAETGDKDALKRICLFESDIGFFSAAYSMAQGTNQKTRTYFQLFDLGDPFDGPVTQDHPGESFATHTFDISTLLGGIHEDQLPANYKNILSIWRDRILEFIVYGKAPCKEFDKDTQCALKISEEGVKQVSAEEYLDCDGHRRRKLLELAHDIDGALGRDILWVDICRRWLMKGC